MDDETLAALYDAAISDDELETLDVLVLRSGLRWQCECRTHVPSELAVCDACGRPRSR